MTTRILAVYDRSPLGDLSVETALRFARTCDEAELIVLAVPDASASAGQRETLHDDLLLFVHLGQRFGIAVDGELVDAPDAERFVVEMRRWRIDRVIVVEPAGQGGGSLMKYMPALDVAAGVVGAITIVAREESP